MGGALVLLGGMGLLIQTLFGCIAILMFGFDSVADWLMAASLTMAFPLYLIGFGSLRVATWVLWAFFLGQWINECFIGSPQLVNPFDWWHGDALFASIVLVNIGYILLARKSQLRKAVRFGYLFAWKTAESA